MSLLPGIAVTGLACRLSGASSLDAFWNHIVTGHDPFRPVPKVRFDPEIFASELPSGRARDVFAALVEDFDLDWRALRLLPAQAEHLHRVERMSLTVMGEALIDAGLRPHNGPIERGAIWFAANSIGPDPWLDPVARIRRFELAAPLRESLDALIPDRAAEIGALIDRVTDLAAPPLEPDALMTSACIIAGRASQLYDFRGGHLAVDAGMCSSMAAVSQGVRALQTGACDVALICAAAPLVTPSSVLAYAHRGYLAFERPRPFAPNAAGTLLGDGAVAIVLERADDVARKRVYAILEGIGYSVAPRFAGSGALAHCVAEAAERALAQAGVSPEGVEQVESRASGIAATDIAEAEGLAVAYPRKRNDRPTLLTSAVPYVGFLQAASGMVALAKAALALHRRCWPGQAALGDTLDLFPCLRVPATSDSWTGARRAAVSDAGPSSIAYHVILADPRDVKAIARPARRAISREPIAIVGAGVIAPGASELESFWRNTLARREEMGDIPRSRWDVDRLIGSNVQLARAFRTRLACTVVVPAVDAVRCRIPPTVAAAIDPSTALAIGVVEQAIRDAGYERDAWAAERVQVVFGQLSLRTAEAEVEKRVQSTLLFALASEAMREVGISVPETVAIIAEARARFDRENRRFSEDTLSAFGGQSCALRAAAAFGFAGELLSVDAACASSLAAVKIAAESLLCGDADVVLAGGVSYHLLPEYYVALGLLGALSTRGGPPFHQDADGFVPAEAAGALVLKRLSDARRANDHVYAVIAGHGVSSDGYGLSIYSPSSAGQRLAMSRAFAAAGIQPTQVDHVEAHGPGAPHGDSTEMSSIAAMYGERPFLPPISIAAAKSLVGHSSSAGAMLSMVRAVLALASKTIPPSGGNGNLAPGLPFGPSIELSRVARPWSSPEGRRRRVAVSAFGMTGINHHVLLEEADSAPFRQDVSDASREHPATRPGQPLNAERFVLVDTPVALPERQPLFRIHGRTLALVPDCGSLWREMEQALSASGARVLRVELPEHASENDVRAAFGSDLSALDGIIDLSAFGAIEASMTLSSELVWSWLKAQSDRSFSLLRVLYERFATSRTAPAWYVAVTSVRSTTAVGRVDAGNPFGAFFQGLARALKQEIPDLICKTVDLDPLASPLPAVAAILRELEDGNDRVDVRISDRRYVTSLRRANFPDSARSLRGLNRGDVFLFSGGGRGVVYHCAVALAQRGINVVVTGRRPLPDPDLDWVRMTDSEFFDFRRAELIRRRGSEEPAQIVRLLDGLELQRQAYANLSKARAAGLPLHYEICDITDLDSVRRVTQCVRTRFGKIDGVGHGAMIEHSGVVPRKSQATIDATLSTKVVGLTNLIEVTREDELKVLVAFGSGVARYGNSGQTDYAASNALMSALLQCYAHSDPRRTHCVSIDWPAWESIGATADPDVAELLRTAGVTSVSCEEGKYWFLSELALGDSPEVVICGEGMLQAWPFLSKDADGRSERGIDVDDDGQVLLPSRWPMLDRAVQQSIDTLTAERLLTIARDRYLPEHLLNGVAVLPATFACEMLAEAAAIACPGYHVQRIECFHVDAPLCLPRALPVTARVVCHVSKVPEFQRVVMAEVRSQMAVTHGQASGERCHSGARVSLSKSPPASLGVLDIPPRSELIHSKSFYHSLRDPVLLGQLFATPHWIQLFGGQVVGTIEPPDLGSMYADISCPVLLACPLVIDAALQIAGSWDGYRNGYTSVPVGIESMVLGRRPHPNERTRALATVVRLEAPDVFYAVTIVGENSEVIAQLGNVHLKRVGSPRITP